ncbi:fungal-specific transcription factor domain-containing protein [Thelonectria olida]|uniref:Fungal-specific transcription factor domain-containing protein n=1 Tax=Thelonectria olida TaxID=1576542 RepID=A0A9P8WFI7_9HYPO|nr:fungal-specific transcription factor domain-containing protein [Thelonectria olida]
MANNDNEDISRAGAARSRGPGSQARRNPRLRLACLRCQRRKIKVYCESKASHSLVRVNYVDLSQELPPIDEADQDQFDENGDSTINLTQFSPSGGPVQDAPTGLSNPLTSTPQEPTRSGPGPQAGEANALTHEIGLVSLATNQDPRYIGPSSGYFLARVMLDSVSRLDERATRPIRDAPFPTQLVEAIQAPLPLPSRDMAKQLCDAYFDVIHLQYPILHEPTFLKILEQAYSQDEMDPVVGFQVFMVLALGAMILSARLKARIPGESYCLSALKYYPNLNLENSIQGVQCLLLLLIFTIHNPYVRLNVWYLNYHCLAALLDLGLQRNISTRSGISLLEQEMRARIFWVIFSFDRIICTMMGRPIGVRDEACELRMPEGLSDEDLVIYRTSPVDSIPRSKDMQFAMHLFRAAKLNSEIKYVANSINRSAPSYAYPPVRDIGSWQSDMLQQLDEWATQIPAPTDDPSDQYLRATCQLRYHGLRMLLLRPSPAIPKPSAEALIQCHKSACESLRLFDHLYSTNLLVHSWITFHSLVLSTITMLFCIKVVPEIACKTEVDVLMGDLSISLSVLSATGEHWSGAKRSRDILDRLGRSTIRWLRGLSNNADFRAAQAAVDGGFNVMQTPLVPGTMPLTVDSAIGSLGADGGMAGFMQNPFEDFIGNDSFAGYFEASESVNVDTIVRDLFQDFIPMYPSFA